MLEVMVYSNCPQKGNLSHVILLSLGTKGLGLWSILPDQLRQLSHPSSYSRVVAWDCHKKPWKQSWKQHPGTHQSLRYSSVPPAPHSSRSSRSLLPLHLGDALGCLAMPRTGGISTAAWLKLSWCPSCSWGKSWEAELYRGKSPHCHHQESSWQLGFHPQTSWAKIFSPHDLKLLEIMGPKLEKAGK